VALPAAGWSGAGASGAGATASSATSAGATAAGGSALAKAAQYRWKHMIAGIATLLAIVLIAATRCSSSDPPGSTVTVPAAGNRGETTADERDGREGRGEPPSMIRARPPELTSEEAAKDWDKVVDKLYKRQFGEARRKLAEWETKHGETAETRDLASQLDALPEHVLRGKRRGRGRDD
jgi:hypothetical protein